VVGGVGERVSIDVESKRKRDLYVGAGSSATVILLPCSCTARRLGVAFLFITTNTIQRLVSSRFTIRRTTTTIVMVVVVVGGGGRGHPPIELSRIERRPSDLKSLNSFNHRRAVRAHSVGDQDDNHGHVEVPKA
jgi:hypothetical protein